MSSQKRADSSSSFDQAERRSLDVNEREKKYFFNREGSGIDNFETDGMVFQASKAFDYYLLTTFKDRVNEIINEQNEENVIDQSRWSKLWRIWNVGYSWFILSIIGTTVGFAAYMLDIVTSWLSDIRRGYCTSHWYYNEKFCCWYSETMGMFKHDLYNDLTFQGSSCTAWKPWTNKFSLNYLIYTAFALLFVLCAAIMVRDVAPLAAGSGISEIKCIISGFLRDSFLSFRVMLVKCVGLPLAIASGLSVGKEGPSVHLATTIGHNISKIFKYAREGSIRYRDICVASAASGVAVAFGSPIGGVLFGIEEMSGGYDPKMIVYSFFCCLSAVGVLHMLNPFRTGQVVLFEVRYSGSWHFFELLFFCFLGIFGGLYGEFVMRLFFLIQKLRKKYLSRWGVLDAAFVTVITSLVSFLNPWLRLDMTLGMELLFQECKSSSSPELINLCDPSLRTKNTILLLIATFARTIFVTFSYGAKVPAGIFVPSMAVGASFGYMIGLIAEMIYQRFPNSVLFLACHGSESCITPGTYALLGAAASLSGIMHLTVTIVVIMFELTGALNFILPTVLVVALANSIGNMLGKTGIADRSIEINGLPLLEPEKSINSSNTINIPITEVMASNLITIPSIGFTWRKLLGMMEGYDFSGYPVVLDSRSNYLIGYLKKSSLKSAFEAAKLEPSFTFDQQLCFGKVDSVGDSKSSKFGESDRIDLSAYMDVNPISVLHTQSIANVAVLFEVLSPSVIFIEKDGNLVGLISKKDLLLASKYYQEDNDLVNPANRHRAVSTERINDSYENIELKPLKLNIE